MKQVSHTGKSPKITTQVSPWASSSAAPTAVRYVSYAAQTSGSR